MINFAQAKRSYDRKDDIPCRWLLLGNADMTPGKIMFIITALLAVSAAVIPHLIWFVGWLVSMFTGHHLKYAPFGWTALGLVLTVILLLSYGFFIGRWQFRVKELTYSNENIPEAFDGFRIVHISDLHLYTFDDRPQMLKRVVDMVNMQYPDLICFTGDLVTIGRSEAEPYTETLSKLSAKNGVVSVFGNHDFLIYERRFRNDDERNAAVDSLADYEKNILEWSLLRNSSQRIEATDGFKILLSHDPSHWESEVNPGLGCTAPFRIGARPEITTITLKCK